MSLQNDLNRLLEMKRERVSKSDVCAEHEAYIRRLQEVNADLLEACKRMRRRAETGKPITVGDVRELEAAIAKAKS